MNGKSEKAKALISLYVAIVMIVAAVGAQVFAGSAAAEKRLVVTVYGYVYDDDGYLVDGLDVTVTDTNTGISKYATTSSGFYQVSFSDTDPPGIEIYPGDTLTITGNYTGPFAGWSGSNSTVAPSPLPDYLQFDLHVVKPPNAPPNEPTNPSPANGSVDVSIHTTLSCYVSDPEGDPMDVSFYWGNDTLIESFFDVTNGTVTTSPLSLDYSTTYYWYVVAEDNMLKDSNTSALWHFTTQANQPPNPPTNPVPPNGATGIPLSTTLSVDVSDPLGDTLDVSFYWANATLIETVTGVPSGGTAETSPLSLALNTTYEWYAVAEDPDGLTATSATWNFTTTSFVQNWYYQDFEGMFPPSGWTLTSLGTGEWFQNAYGSHSYEPPGTGTYYANAWDSPAQDYTGASLWTPQFDCTGLTNVDVVFERNFQDFAGYGEGQVNVYSGGMDPSNFEEQILFVTTDDPSSGVHTELSFDPSGYADPSEVYIEFYYTDDGYGSAWGFSIDDLNVSAPAIIPPVHDVMPTVLNSPGPTEMEGDITVNATVMNAGTFTETFDVNCTIYDITGTRATILAEGFEGGSVPPAGWTLIQYNPYYTWEIDDYNPYEGSYYASCFYDDTYTDVQDEWLISPVMDFTGHTNVHLSFAWMMSYYWGVDPYNNYNLSVYISTDGGSTWTFLWNEHAEGMFDNWVWYEKDLDLSAYDGMSNVQIAFVYDGYDGAQASIDAIEVYDYTPPGVAYAATQTVTGLPPYGSTYVEFTPAWSATPGTYLVNITTLLGSDDHPENDYLEETVVVTGVTDVGVEAINSPTEGEVIPSIVPVVVNATIKNYGTVPALRGDVHGATLGLATDFNGDNKEPKAAVQAPPQPQRAFSAKLSIYSGGGTVILPPEEFEGSFPPAGWTVINNGAACQWERNDVTGRPNYAGGNGYCADADADACGSGSPWPMDTELWTPPFSLVGTTAPTLSFIAAYNYLSGDYAEVDISTDGGSTWTNLLHWAEDHDAYGPGEAVSIDLSPFIGSSNCVVRFHYYADSWDWYFEVDAVAIYDGDPPGLVHEETIPIPTLDVGEEYYAVFSPWYGAGGDYTAVVQTMHPDEMVPGNDMKMVNFTIEYVAMDVSVDSIDNPEDGGVYQAGEITVQSTVSNNGDVDATFDVNCSIYRILEGMRDVSDWLGYDGPNDNAIGLTSGGTFEGAIRLTPTELSGYDGYVISVVKFHHGMAGSTPHEHSGNIKIYEGDTPTSPGTLITSEPWTSDVYDWVEVPLSSPVTIDETKDYWISVEVTHPAGEYPLGCDAGPAVDGKGDWIYLSPGPWEELQNYGLDYNWNIRAGVEPGGPPQELVYFDEETVTDLPPDGSTTIDFLPAWDAEPGEYRIVVTALVQDDNPENNEQEISVIILADENPPVSDLTVTLDPDGYVKRASRFTITATDAEDSPWKIYYKIDGVLFEKDWNEDAVFQLNEIWGYAPGPHIIEYWAVDLAGNEEAHHLETYVLDVDGPEVDLAFSGIHEVTLNNIDQITPETLIEIIAVDDRCGVDRIEYRLGEDGELMPYEGPFTLPDGYYDLFIVAHDRLDNVGEKHYIIQVGGGEPATFCHLSPAEPTGENGWYVTPVTVTLEATDDASGVSHTLYKIDNGEWKTYTGPFVIDTDGAHTVYYYSVDNAGNEEHTQTRQVNIDFYGPEITIQKPANYIYLFDRPILPWIGYRPVVIGSISITATVVDTATSGIQNVELYVDNQLKGTYSGNVVYTLDEPSFGETAIKIVAKDVAGNTQIQTIRALIYNW